jgi:DNA mismatch repair protein MutL
LTMPKISVLPDFIASQIAAGEVVERPASVVKELVENAIDAGAHQIEVAVGSGCRDIRVADDGCGMSPDDAVLAFQRHATSKLACADDLSNLRTLGFRGEALPSIASVAHVSCMTRSAEAANGTKVEIEEGQVTAHETGCAVGTVIEVQDLFYNVPARLKFLKKPATEFANIHEIVQSLALAHPKIVFQLLKEGEVTLKTSGSGKLAETMLELNLVNPRNELIAITGVDMRFGMAVYGQVGRPPLCRGDKKGIIIIVNNRPVRCSLALKALEYAFSDLIPKGKHPVAVLSVTIDPHQIDVNVHPTKKEIRYSNSSDVYLAIQKALVEGTHRVPEPEAKCDEKEAPPAEAVFPAGEGTTGSSSTDTAGGEPALNASAPAAITAPEPLQEKKDGDAAASAYAGGPASPVVRESREIAVGGKTYQRIQQLGLRDRLAATPPSRTAQYQSPGALPKQATLPAGWRLTGYIYNTYLLLDTPCGFKIVEQHIAHERVVYERLLCQQEQPGRITDAVQRLVISAPLNLTVAQRACLAGNLDFIKSLGFDFDFQPNYITCSQVPLELATKDYAGTVQQILEQLLSCETAQFSLEATKSLACQAAVKNGMALSETEIIDLVSEWLSCPRNDTCPHGRPVCQTFTKDQLYALFHPA